MGERLSPGSAYVASQDILVRNEELKNTGKIILNQWEQTTVTFQMPEGLIRYGGCNFSPMVSLRSMFAQCCMDIPQSHFPNEGASEPAQLTLMNWNTRRVILRQNGKEAGVPLGQIGVLADSPIMRGSELEDITRYFAQYDDGVRVAPNVFNTNRSENPVVLLPIRQVVIPTRAEGDIETADLPSATKRDTYYQKLQYTTYDIKDIPGNVYQFHDEIILIGTNDMPIPPGYVAVIQGAMSENITLHHVECRFLHHRLPAFPQIGEVTNGIPSIQALKNEPLYLACEMYRVTYV